MADAGYESLDNYLYLEDNRQTSFIKPINYEVQKTKRFRQQIGRRENMQYDGQEDCYICAAGRKLLFHHESTQRNYRCENCVGCPCREACCKTKDDRKAKELQIKPDLLRLSSRSLERILTQRGIQLRVNRSIQVEGTFGVLKNDRKFKRFLTRGRTNISTELYLLCLGFNLNKLWAKCNTGRLKTHLSSGLCCHSFAMGRILSVMRLTVVSETSKP